MTNATNTSAEVDREALLARLRRVDGELGVEIARLRLAQFDIQECGILLRHRRLDASGARLLLWESGADVLVFGLANHELDTGGRAAA